MKSLVPETAVISEQAAQDVLGTDGAIGICPAANLKSLEDAVSIDGIALTDQTAKNGTYGASRNIMLVTGKNAPESAKQFSDYCFSDQAKENIAATGFTPLK